MGATPRPHTQSESKFSNLQEYVISPITRALSQLYHHKHVPEEGPLHSHRTLTILDGRLLHTHAQHFFLPKKMPSRKELCENMTDRWLYSESERECSVLPCNALLTSIFRVDPDERSVQCRGTSLCGVHLFRSVRVQFMEKIGEGSLKVHLVFLDAHHEFQPRTTRSSGCRWTTGDPLLPRSRTSACFETACRGSPAVSQSCRERKLVWYRSPS